MNPSPVIKLIVSAIVSTGVSAIVGNAVKQSTPENVKTITKVCIIGGGFALSSFAGSRVSHHASEQVDTTIAQIKEFKNVFSKNH